MIGRLRSRLKNIRGSGAAIGELRITLIAKNLPTAKYAPTVDAFSGLDVLSSMYSQSSRGANSAPAGSVEFDAKMILPTTENHSRPNPPASTPSSPVNATRARFRYEFTSPLFRYHSESENAWPRPTDRY